MQYHPADSVEVYRKADKSVIEHLWYKLNFFQVKEIQAKDIKKKQQGHELDYEQMHPDLQSTPYLRTVLSAARARQLKAVALLSDDYEVRICSGEIADKLVNGLGGAHVRETALTLHPVYGVPYIPGSSLKGVMRHWFIQAVFDGKEPADDLKPDKQEMRRIFLDLFGSQDQKGLLQCYDGWLMDYVIEPDILTVHFPKYYSGEKAAGDNQSPVPIPFYVLSAGKLECLMTIPRNRTTQSGYPVAVLMDLALNSLNKALTEQGIGSKTASGYGVFATVQDVTEARLSVIKESIRTQRLKQAQEEEARREEAVLAAMTPAERLVYTIEHLGENESDRELSKSTLYQQVIEMAESVEMAPAAALKHYWEKIGEWKVKPKKKKQYERVEALKKYLDE